MLKTLGRGAEAMGALVFQVIPEDVMLPPNLKSRIEPSPRPLPLTFSTILFDLNSSRVWMNGRGYYSITTPPVIKRNILENPAGTPAILLISPKSARAVWSRCSLPDSGITIANASLSNEGTAAAEAMTMSMGSLPASRAKRPGKTYVVSHLKKGGSKRDICFIPVSAHGTNSASAARTAMQVVPIKCNTATGNLDMADLEDNCKKHTDELGAITITYPNTYGVFEPDVRRACELVPEHGGFMYVDGANMNAQVGLTSPGAIGADFCHLNLHKFCIPHGGGRPGVGPICVEGFLNPFLPHHKDESQILSAAFGSASILPISWMSISAMGKSRARQY
ncbi:putative Glycine dehydrogenase [Ilyonectria robusta]